MDCIGLVGYAGAGKDTVGLYLNEVGYQSIAFADGIKDCLASMFMWDREMLAGRTPESRAWREQVDPWWADKLGIPHFSPRFAMTTIGTDTVRRHFHDEIWMLGTERKMQAMGGKIVVTDLRHQGELKMMARLGARIYRVRRGPEPKWAEVALKANSGDASAKEKMDKVFMVHESEWGWLGHPVDGVIDNDGDIDELNRNVAKVILNGHR